MIILLQVGSAIWVGFDARGRDFSGNAIARSPKGWVAGCLLLWIICFPLYLSARSSVPRKGASPAAPAPPGGAFSHPQFIAPTAPERMSTSVAPPATRSRTPSG